MSKKNFAGWDDMQHEHNGVRVERSELARVPEECDRLMQEINILKLEGALFCFDKRAAASRRGTITLADSRKQPVTVTIHPEFGQPSVLAYKVLQAIFLKLSIEGCSFTEDGRCEYNDLVYFSQRELARLTGRKWGTSASEQLHRAVMQLRSTLIDAYLLNKETKEWALANFQVLGSAFFAGHGETITKCAVRLAPEVIASLNRRHVAFFNLERLSTLDTLGLVLYKRVFYNFSILLQEGKGRRALKFTKDYEAICREWLGGLKTLRYRADILKDQLGRHLEAILATGLIRRYELERNAAGTGFNLTFYPGQGFFEDYEAYYQKAPAPKRIAATAEAGEVKALELVAHFHRSLGHDTTRFEEHELAYAEELLARHDEAAIRDLIDYGIERAEKSKFAMLFFNALKRFVADWEANESRRRAREKVAAKRASCAFCAGRGILELKEHGTNRPIAHPCPHQASAVLAIEEHLNAFRP